MNNHTDTHESIDNNDECFGLNDDCIVIIKTQMRVHGTDYMVSMLHHYVVISLWRSGFQQID